MERIFEAKTDREIELVKILKTSANKNSRKKALQELLKINGCDKNDLFAIRSKEVYARIEGKPKTWRRFFSATIVYDDRLIHR